MNFKGISVLAPIGSATRAKAVNGCRVLPNRPDLIPLWTMSAIGDTQGVGLSEPDYPAGVRWS